MELQSSKRSILLILLTIFCIIELSSFYYIKQQIESDVWNTVYKYSADINKEINDLMGYKEEIVTGELGYYAPDSTPLDLTWFKNNNYRKFPDSTYTQARMKNFISSFSENKLLWPLDKEPPYTIIKNTEILYPIIFPSSVWEIKRLYKSGSFLYVQHIVPYAWGYKKCDSYEKQFRPTGYNACQDAFDYLTKESRKYASSFINESGKIDIILNLENKYYYIDFVKDEEDEMLERNKFLNYRYGYVHNYYSVVFFEEEVPEVEYKIYAKHSLIKKEILHKTLNVFLITSVVTLLILTIIYWCIKDPRKGKQ